MKPPIVLLTDYGYQDPYAGVLHGIILSRFPSAHVIDLTHGIEPQNILQAGLYLLDSFRYFPKGSVFVCVVDPGVGTNREILCVKSDSYYFFAPDNGLLTEILERDPRAEIRKLNTKKFSLEAVSATFHGRDLFAPAAAALAKKPTLFKTIGPQAEEYARLHLPEVRKTNRLIEGEVIYFDHFGNAVTNIRMDDASGSFWASAQAYAGFKKIGPIVKTYGSGKSPVVLWNSSKRLEIAVPKAKASSFLKTGTVIKVQREK